METFVVNGLAYDIIDADKKEVQVHWPDLGYVGKFYRSPYGCASEIRDLIRAKNPTGILGIPENVVNPKDGTSYTVVAVGGDCEIRYETFDKVLDRRLKLGYKEVDLEERHERIHGLSHAKITEVRLPKSIRKIGHLAFGYTDLTKIVFPEGVTEIKDCCFTYCNHLKEIEFPEGVKEIPYECCWNCSGLKEIIIPSSVKVIQRHAFGFCENLKKVIIPSSVDLIKKGAFEYCDGLKEAIIYNNDGVITIENGAFPSETKITYKSGMLSKLLGK